MIKIDQTILSSKDGKKVKGNCFSACLASLLEIKLDQVPYFAGMRKNVWQKNLFQWLHSVGYEYDGWLSVDQFSQMKKLKGVDGYFIVAGESPRGAAVGGHSVIYKNGKMVHDPHPSRAGLKTVKGAYIIIKS